MPGLFDGTPLERPVTCERCNLPLGECACPRAADGRIVLPKDQSARVSRERRGGGKMVTIVSGLDASASDLPAMLKELKAKLGTGGTLCDGRLELQGDHLEKLVALLKERGFPAKPSGG
ncbi:MAG: translation initiation factor [Planctomycetes bacterium]|nr:translation initiation factor [Planctomycetota bacterium]